MTYHVSESPERPVRHYTIATIKVFAFILALSAITAVSWNLFVPDLFGLHAIRGKEALGMILLFGVAATLLRRPNRNYHQNSAT